MNHEEFKKWLKEFDEDKDGRISRRELQEAIRAMGGRFTRWKSMIGMKLADKDPVGFIDGHEIYNLKNFAPKHLGIMICEFRNGPANSIHSQTSFDWGQNSNESRRLQEMAKEFDPDKDGRISRRELQEAIRAMGGRFFTRWKSMIGTKSADKDRNGFIDEHEIYYLKDFALKHLVIIIYDDTE
ncbi:hypothetical protein ACH5RR_027220 [Cinchona calisaya]|uniref:EF-hand domain-containing protein n=1 Tax=Cinchona calisaya TaxID=153742 RepID=A0ABD2Z9U4_9GENT